MLDVIVVGAGAAGCFFAAVLAELYPNIQMVVVEKTRQPLAKVKISGGGRCNVTHHCFDIPTLIEGYPRGKQFLQGAFHRFQPKDMIQWLHAHGVEVVVEKDGRCFPSTHQSQTIIDCLYRCMTTGAVTLSLEKEVLSLRPIVGGWEVSCKGGEVLFAKHIVWTTGGITKSHAVIAALGHKIVPSVPSLFSFTIPSSWIHSLPGSVAPCASVSIKGTHFTAKGPLLITHTGIGGPAVLRLSSYAARFLADVSYQAEIEISWAGERDLSLVKEALYEQKKMAPGKKVVMTPLFSLSKRLWKALLEQINVSCIDKAWAALSRVDIDKMAEGLLCMTFAMAGKSTHKEEFVTAGGVSLDEVDQKTLQSRLHKGLYFAGEVLDIDGITGGFNFQSAWTTAWSAATAIQASLLLQRQLPL